MTAAEMMHVAFACFAVAGLSMVILVLAVFAPEPVTAPVPMSPLSWSYDGITWERGIWCPR